jgi:hypothetical protein
VYLVRHEGHGLIEFANGFDDHRKTIVPAVRFIKILVVDTSGYSSKNFATTPNSAVRFVFSMVNFHKPN